ncbi:helix-turn-helix domain-containing protein [Pseudomonas sp. H11T01]|uniref:helix-turn-helix domain-containing protein n=1 Tax=Pseudomonas sp. H11T01 TaxID=3402749 RepID=UPI003AC7B3AD
MATHQPGNPAPTNVQAKRYLTLRRLDRMKQLVHAGQTLSDAAIEAGFFDQSLSRRFKKAFGLSPSRWCNPSKALDH